MFGLQLNQEIIPSTTLTNKPRNKEEKYTSSSAAMVAEDLWVLLKWHQKWTLKKCSCSGLRTQSGWE